MSSPEHIAALPTLSYSKSKWHNRISSIVETGTEYNSPTRTSFLVPPGSGGSPRVRGHYVSLDQVITDGSRLNFCVERLYSNGGNSSSSTLGEGNADRLSKLSPDLSSEGRYPSGYGTYPPTPDYGLKTVETDFLKTPSPSFFPRGLSRLHKKHPFSQWFETPKWKTFAVHTLFCLLAYPFLLIFVIIAKGRTLFWTRVAVGVGCGITGVLLGISLVGLARTHLEAAAWATVIHQSRFHDHPGVRLKDIAPLAEDPVSAYNGLGLLWKRHRYPGTARKNRIHYDARPWSIHIILFLILVAVSGFLPFIFGRLVNIDTEVKSQREKYHEARIKGDISDADIARAANLTPAFNDFRITWTIAPYSNRGGLPPVVEFPWKSVWDENKYDTIYFSETTQSQLQSNGSGFGTFITDALPAAKNLNTLASVSSLQAGFSPGNIVRQPRWGIRIKCTKLPDAQNNITNLSRTYVFLPNDMVQNLVDYFQKPFPTDFGPPALESGDQDWPPNVDRSKTLTVISFYDNGVNHAYFSKPMYGMGNDDTSFVSLEVVLIRLNTTLASQGEFAIKARPLPDENGTTTYIGYDAAVCVEVFEPWVVEVYNNTAGAPTTVRIVEKTNVVGDFNTDNIRENMQGKPISDPNTRRNLTSKRIQPVYVAAHQNGINQISKDNGRDSYYVPSTIAISYTDGEGPYGYTSLSADKFATAKASADANNTLPYFVGSGSIVARIYPDHVLAFAHIEQLVITLVVLFVLGSIAALFVPRLPMNVPRRGFELYSWFAAFYADELVGCGKGGAASKIPGQGAPCQVGLSIGRRMRIEEIEQHIGDIRFRYVS
ncbi:hypothetical protein AN958_04098 [Leucoagaricus sp. SymC.cos]|nr:hypothetical protein AN958_04098 [Leucoagaricus sp. SymC.cos]